MTSPPPAPASMSVLVAVTGRAGAAAKAVAAWRRCGDPVLEVIVAVPAGRERLRGALADALDDAAELAGPDPVPLRLLPVPGRSDVGGLWRAAAEQARGDVIVLADGTGRPEPAVPAALVAALDAAPDDDAAGVRAGRVLGAGVAALAADDGLAHAGHVPAGPGAAPWPLLAGQPPEDLAEVGPLLPVAMLAAAPLAVRRADAGLLARLPATGGPASAVAAADRALRQPPGRVVLALGPVVRHATGPDDDPGPWPDRAAWTGPAWNLPRAGLRVDRGPDGPVVARLPQAGATPSAPRLRWALVTASPAGRGGEAWGDTHFARDLAAALRRLGQQVAVVRRGAAESPARGLDDVVVVLRGLVRVDPVPGPVSMLWVISHPDLVEPDEPAGYDVMLAASVGWSRRATERLGRPVVPLLQATDPARFHPGLAVPDTGEPVLFVGSSRRQDRPMVRDALAAGADLAVYGAGWEHLPPGVVRAPFLPPDQVGAAYRAAGVVLNDHWPDMARDGFLSNRLFDGVAAGARVVSDDAEGLAEVFGASVRVVHGADDLRALLAGPRDAIVGDDDARRAAAARIAAQHSFDARAATLLDLALAARARRG